MTKKRFRNIAAYIFSVFFIIAGVFHFLEGKGFAAMIPTFLPFPLIIIYITAIIEFVLAVFIIWPNTRKLAGTLSAVYLVLVFPANVYAAFSGIPAPGQEHVNETLLWLRLLFQPLLIWWVWWATREK